MSQNNGGIPHQSPSRAPSLSQVIQEHARSRQHQVEDWEEEISEDEAVAGEEELARVKQEIERLRQEQEAITRRHTATELVEARRQYIDTKEQDYQSFGRQLISIANRNKGKSLHLIKH
jgi:hypothetical protein